jgi:hypothetical protein
MEDEMKKIAIAALAAGLLAIPAFAQEAELPSEVEALLRSNGVEVTVPADATNEQLATILAMLNTNSDMNGSEMKAEVEKILGM